MRSSSGSGQSPALFSDKELRAASVDELTVAALELQRYIEGLVKMEKIPGGASVINKPMVALQGERLRINSEIYRRQRGRRRWRSLIALVAFPLRWLAHRNDDSVRLTLRVMDRMVRQNEIPGLVWLQSDVKAMLRDNPEKARVSLVEEKMPPEALVCLLASNIAFQKLSSGQCHVYRGVLDMEGTEIRSAYIATSKRMIELGVQTQKEHDSDLQALRTQIAEMG